MTLFAYLYILGADIDAGNKVAHVVHRPGTDFFHACVALPGRFEIERVRGRLAVGGAGRWRCFLMTTRGWRELYPLAAGRRRGAQVKWKGGHKGSRFGCSGRRLQRPASC